MRLQSSSYKISIDLSESTTWMSLDLQKARVKNLECL